MYLGIDSGSTSMKYALVEYQDGGSNNFKISKIDYKKNNGNLIGTLSKFVDDLKGINFSGIGVTGSARYFIGKILNADLTIDEITAHRKGVNLLYPDVSTIFEIGGQDSKLIYKDGQNWNALMNTACAAGTGSFLEQQAARLNLDIKSFYAKGLSANSGYPIGSKCTVFAESDMITAQGRGIALDKIIKGVHEGMINNYFNNLCLGLDLKGVFIFEGATSFNELLVSVLQKKLHSENYIKSKDQLIIPYPYNAVMGAIGTAEVMRNRKINNFRTLNKWEEIEISEEFPCTNCKVRCGAMVQIMKVGKSSYKIGGCE
jgi:predicted CoA-substrate-specific enzyme activase